MSRKQDQATQNLIRLYKQAREKLYRLIVDTDSVGLKKYYNTILQQVNKELKKLQKATDSFIATELPKIYREELESIYTKFEKHGLYMSRSYMFAQLHRDAIYEAAREMQYQIADGLASVGRQIQRYLDTARDEALRAAGMEEAGNMFASGRTPPDMRQALIQKLQNEGFLTVQYGDQPGGYQVRLDAYASMVARSTTRELTNTAQLNTAEQWGYDLVFVPEHYPTCELCAPLQGRVFSVSGKDKRFPYLYDLPGFRDGYRNFHPNCRHVIVVTAESMWTPEQREKYFADAGKPLNIDTRSEEERALYNEQQRKNRQARQTLYQYERYKAVLGKDAPKSLAAFKRLKKSDGENWKFMQLDYRRRSALLSDPSLALPCVDTATAADEKFTGYLFNPDKHDGYSKGVAFTSRLGYNINNWEELRSEILQQAKLYSATKQQTDEYGTRYEQRVILYGKKGKPANVIIGWTHKEGKTWMSTAFMKEVDGWKK